MNPVGMTLRFDWRRMGIAEMFVDFKKHDFDLERMILYAF
jgi:hypothetical protein